MLTRSFLVRLLIDVFYGFILAMVAISLFSCKINSEVSPKDRQVISLTEQEWVRTDMPKAPECLEGIGVVTLSADNFMRTCGKPAFFSEGCVTDRGVGNRHGKLLNLSPYVTPDAHLRTVAHLTLHALCECTSTKTRDRTDDAHFRQDVWHQNATKTSVETRVMQELEAHE